MIRRPPRSTRTEHTLSLHDALPICITTRSSRTRFAASALPPGLVLRRTLTVVAAGRLNSGVSPLTMHCALCLLPKPLQDSHIIPEFLYGVMYDDKHRYNVDRKSTRLNSSH